MSAFPVFLSGASCLGPLPLLGHEPPELRPRPPPGPARRPSPGSGRSGSRRCRAAGRPGRRGCVAVPRRLVSSTAASKIAVPVRSVPRNAASSASITVWMCGASLAQLRELVAQRADRGRRPARAGSALAAVAARAAPLARRTAAAGCGCCGAGSGAARSRGPRCDGMTPSATSITAVRTWSATTRSATSVRWSRPYSLLGQLGRAVEHLPHGVDLVDVVDALQQRGHPLQAHAGVDVAGRQLAQDVEVLLARAPRPAGTA